MKLFYPALIAYAVQFSSEIKNYSSQYYSKDGNYYNFFYAGVNPYRSGGYNIAKGVRAKRGYIYNDKYSGAYA